MKKTVFLYFLSIFLLLCTQLYASDDVSVSISIDDTDATVSVTNVFDASKYLNVSSITATYLQKSSAAATYLQKTAKAADSELLDGVNGSDYATDTEVAAATTSAVLPYLSKSSATATYYQQDFLDNKFSDISIATSTCLTKSSAAATYLQKSGGTMTGSIDLGAYDLQTSSSVEGVTKIIWADGTVQVSSPPAGGGWIGTATSDLDMADFGINNVSTMTTNSDGLLKILLTEAKDRFIINKSSTGGVEDNHPIKFDSSITGATGNEPSEALLGLYGSQSYGLYVDKWTYLNDRLLIAGYNNSVLDDRAFSFGSSYDVKFIYVPNGIQDDFLHMYFLKYVASDTNVLMLSHALGFTGMTHFNDYLSPTIIIANRENADTNDASFVVIGERDNADCSAQHYFDMWALVSATDGTPDATTTEIPATFRVGYSTSATFDHGITGILLSTHTQVSGGLYPQSSNTLPSSGYNEGSLFYNTDDNTLYISTETVTSTQSWKSVW